MALPTFTFNAVGSQPTMTVQWTIDSSMYYVSSNNTSNSDNKNVVNYIEFVVVDNSDSNGNTTSLKIVPLAYSGNTAVPVNTSNFKFELGHKYTVNVVYYYTDSDGLSNPKLHYKQATNKNPSSNLYSLTNSNFGLAAGAPSSPKLSTDTAINPLYMSSAGLDTSDVTNNKPFLEIGLDLTKIDNFSALTQIILKITDVAAGKTYVKSLSSLATPTNVHGNPSDAVGETGPFAILGATGPWGATGPYGTTGPWGDTGPYDVYGPKNEMYGSSTHFLTNSLPSENTQGVYTYHYKFVNTITVDDDTITLASGKTYYVTADVVNALGHSYTMDKANTIKLYISPVPVAPANLISTSSTSLAVSGSNTPMVGLQWDNDLYTSTSYNVLRATSVTGSYTLVATVPKASGSVTTYVDKSVTAWVTYYYKVQGQFNLYGVNSNMYEVGVLSACLQVTPKTVMKAAIGFTLKETSETTIALSWNVVENASSYLITWDQGTGDFMPIPSSDIIITGTSAVHTHGFTDKTTYKYKIFSIADSNNFGTVNSISSEAEIKFVTYPLVVKDLLVVPIGDSKIKATWTNDNNDFTYTIYYSTNDPRLSSFSESDRVRLGVISGTNNFISETLVANTNYFYHIISSNSHSNPVSATVVNNVVTTSKNVTHCVIPATAYPDVASLSLAFDGLNATADASFSFNLDWNNLSTATLIASNQSHVDHYIVKCYNGSTATGSPVYTSSSILVSKAGEAQTTHNVPVSQLSGYTAGNTYAFIVTSVYSDKSTSSSPPLNSVVTYSIEALAPNSIARAGISVLSNNGTGNNGKVLPVQWKNPSSIPSFLTISKFTLKGCEYNETTNLDIPNSSLGDINVNPNDTFTQPPASGNFSVDVYGNSASNGTTISKNANGTSRYYNGFAVQDAKAYNVSVSIQYTATTNTAKYTNIPFTPITKWSSASDLTSSSQYLETRSLYSLSVSNITTATGTNNTIDLSWNRPQYVINGLNQLVINSYSIYYSSDCSSTNLTIPGTFNYYGNVTDALYTSNGKTTLSGLKNGTKYAIVVVPIYRNIVTGSITEAGFGTNGAYSTSDSKPADSNNFTIKANPGFTLHTAAVGAGASSKGKIYPYYTSNASTGLLSVISNFIKDIVPYNSSFPAVDSTGINVYTGIVPTTAKPEVNVTWASIDAAATTAGEDSLKYYVSLVPLGTDASYSELPANSSSNVFSTKDSNNTDLVFNNLYEFSIKTESTVKGTSTNAYSPVTKVSNIKLSPSNGTSEDVISSIKCDPGRNDSSSMYFSWTNANLANNLPVCVYVIKTSTTVNTDLLSNNIILNSLTPTFVASDSYKIFTKDSVGDNLVLGTNYTIYICGSNKTTIGNYPYASKFANATFTHAYIPNKVSAMTVFANRTTNTLSAVWNALSSRDLNGGVFKNYTIKILNTDHTPTSVSDTVKTNSLYTSTASISLGSLALGTYVAAISVATTETNAEHPILTSDVLYIPLTYSLPPSDITILSTSTFNSVGSQYVTTLNITARTNGAMISDGLFFVTPRVFSANNVYLQNLTHENVTNINNTDQVFSCTVKFYTTSQIIADPTAVYVVLTSAAGTIGSNIVSTSSHLFTSATTSNNSISG